MAKVSAHVSNVVQISPEISDDEVFHADAREIWRPLQQSNGISSSTLPSKQPTTSLVKHHHDGSCSSIVRKVSFDGVSLGHVGSTQSLDIQDDSVCLDIVSAKESTFARSRSRSVFDDHADDHATDNTNNNRPGGLCSRPTFDPGVERLPRCQAFRSESFELPSSRPQVPKLDRQHSIVDGLLFEIYDRWHGSRRDSFDSDTFTECSSTSEFVHSRWDLSYEQNNIKQYNRSYLESQSVEQLKKMVTDLQRSIGQVSSQLVRQLKRRDRRTAKLGRNCDVVTAVLQAASLKRQIDTKMKFSLDPAPGQSAFEQWKDAMKAVNRLPMGIPCEFRKKAWLSLADHYIRNLKIDWQKTVRLAFNERSNPDDDKLGMQIVKDLHRTGCSSFSGQDNEEDRAVLKRVLLAYARWNKRIGYCQGFNVIAALLLNVMERKEDDALKVMIYLIDHVLPESYFDNNLRALSVDMAVFRDLLRLTLPTLSRHLDRLQAAAQDVNTGACYEPPLTNVFTMQWFLTLFATCLPKEVVLRVWDAVLLEGSEVLLRTALCLWGKLARRMMKVDSADEFYCLMGELSSDMMEGTVFNSDDMITAIYAIAPFPFPQLTELREKYTYNIRPFSSAATAGRRASSRWAKAVLYSDEDDLDEEELRAITSFPGMGPVQGTKNKGMDISLVGPGAFAVESDQMSAGRDAVYMERMTTDITALKMQYEKLRQRQRQAHVIITAASHKKAVEVKQRTQAPVLVPKIQTPLAMNHLFVGRVQGGRNRLVTSSPQIAFSPSIAARNSLMTKQLQAVAAAQAHRKRTGSTSSKGSHSAPTSPTAGSSKGEECSRPDEEEEKQDFTFAQPQAVGDERDGERGAACDGGKVPTNDREGSLCSMKVSSEPCLESFSKSADESVNDTTSLQKCLLESGSEGDLVTLEKVNNTVSFSDLQASCVSEADSGVHLSYSSPGASTESSPTRKALRPSSIELGQDSLKPGNHCMQSDYNAEKRSYSSKTVKRHVSMPNDDDAVIEPAPAAPSSPVKLSSCVASPSVSVFSSQGGNSSLPSSSHCQMQVSPVRASRPFNPFPVKHVNTNRAKTGLKLGLYTPSTVEHILSRKARTASS